MIDTVETAPATMMSQNVTDAYALHDHSLLLSMLGIQTNDWNGERTEKVLPYFKNIENMLTLLDSLALLTRKYEYQFSVDCGGNMLTSSFVMIFPWNFG